MGPSAVDATTEECYVYGFKCGTVFDQENTPFDAETKSSADVDTCADFPQNDSIFEGLEFKVRALYADRLRIGSSPVVLWHSSQSEIIPTRPFLTAK